jgi:hypothetical protein
MDRYGSTHNAHREATQDAKTIRQQKTIKITHKRAESLADKRNYLYLCEMLKDVAWNIFY